MCLREQAQETGIKLYFHVTREDRVLPEQKNTKPKEYAEIGMDADDYFKSIITLSQFRSERAFNFQEVKGKCCGRD